MLINFLNCLIKFFGIYLSTGYSYFKILNYKKNILTIALLSIIFSSATYFMQLYFSSLSTFIILGFVFNLVLSKISKKVFGYSLLIFIIASSVSYIIFGISTGITASIWIQFSPYKHNFIMFIISDIFEISVIFLLFKIKRFKHGFPYFKTKTNPDYIDIFIITICTIILFIYFMLNLYTKYSFQQIYLGLIMFSILLVVIIYKSFILYQKQKLQTQALKDYEQELVETKLKLSTALEEKQKLVKSNHEFYHRQEAINKKLDDLIANQKSLTNSEFGEDLTYISDRLKTLSNEYVEKTKTLPKLDKTNIQEIDDMLSYMQSECSKNNIELLLKIECDINHIIENYITKSQLETLLGDLIQNAIIAINHCNNEFKSIMAVFGIKQDTYVICILDSGIPFETTTLVNLGLQPASTHLDEGGTGIGFITTFETINSCNASFIINEITNSNYTKSLEIKFDNKNEYVIISKRIKEINEVNNSNREIILRG